MKPLNGVNRNETEVKKGPLVLATVMVITWMLAIYTAVFLGIVWLGMEVFGG